MGLGFSPLQRLYNEDCNVSGYITDPIVGSSHMGIQELM